MKKPLVSTLICTYNASNFIRSTIESALQQTYQNQEILILDNGSKDDTREIIEVYAKNDPRIHLFYEGKNLGAYAGLNYLLDRANGEYIAIQDHDDIRHTAKLQKQVDFLDAHPHFVGTGTWTLMYYGVSKIGFLYDMKARATSKVIHTSLMFRNTWVRYDTTNDFLCDGYFMENVLTKSKPLIHVIPEALTLHYYKENGTNYSEQRFILNAKNIKRYFDVYGFHRYNTLLFIYLMICKLLPLKRKWKFDFRLLRKVKGAKPKIELERNPDCKNLLQYY